MGSSPTRLTASPEARAWTISVGGIFEGGSAILDGYRLHGSSRTDAHDARRVALRPSPTMASTATASADGHPDPPVAGSATGAVPTATVGGLAWSVATAADRTGTDGAVDWSRATGSVKATTWI